MKLNKPKIIFFDLADTLLHKPGLFEAIKSLIRNDGYAHTKKELRQVHKQCREAIVFPNQTNKDFFMAFNHAYLCALGIVETGAISTKIYKLCRSLSWEPFDDVSALGEITLKKGIISNWDLSLIKTVDKYFPDIFDVKYGSADLKVRKPDRAFFDLACSTEGVLPSEVLYIGDSPRLDMVPGEVVGFETCLLDRYDDFPHYKGRKLKSLSQLSTLFH